MGRIIDIGDPQLYEHEGYVAHILDDGTSAHDNWTAAIEEHTVAWRAECTCGWHGLQHDSGGPCTPDRGQYDAVMADWEDIHVRILLRATGLINQLEAIETANNNLSAALREAVANGTTAEPLAGALRITTAELRRRYPHLEFADAPTPDGRPVRPEAPTL